MSNILNSLKQKQQEIARLQKEKARQEGQRDQLLSQLEEKFNVTTLEDAKEKLQGLTEEVTKNEKALEKLDKEMSEIISNASTSEKISS